MSSYHIYPCGDHAVTIELGTAIDETTHRKVMALFRDLSAQAIEGVVDIIPAYTTVTIVYDLSSLIQKNKPGSVYEMMRIHLQDAAEIISIQKNQTRLVKIPVCYDVELAPDLVSLAAAHLITTDEVIALHTGKTYTVYMIGFLPGFAYMGKIDDRIATPRKTKPRTHVAAGSVGIAGAQTGIYPFDSPGGWQLIGQTPLVLFDHTKPSPCYFEPGDEVQFYEITFDEFHKLKKA